MRWLYPNSMPAGLVALFVLIPILEIALIIQVGERLGLLSTLFLLIAASVFGAVLAKREGLEVWGRLRRALDEGRMPSDEVADGFLVLLGAALLLTPGFLTDALGFLLLMPVTRSPIGRVGKRVLGAYVSRRVVEAVDRAGSSTGSGRAKRVEVVKVERVEVDHSSLQVGDEPGEPSRRSLDEEN